MMELVLLIYCSQRPEKSNSDIRKTRDTQKVGETQV